MIVKLSAIKLAMLRGHQCIRDTTDTVFTRIVVNSASSLKCYKAVTTQKVQKYGFSQINTTLSARYIFSLGLVLVVGEDSKLSQYWRSIIVLNSSLLA